MNIKEKGFTLIELLIVIGIIAILATAIIVAVNPGEILKDAREVSRESHMLSIGNAFYNTIIDQSNEYSSVENILVDGCIGWADPQIWDNFNDDCAQVIGLSGAPVDPAGGGDPAYRIRATEDGSRLQIASPSAESKWHYWSTGEAKTF